MNVTPEDARRALDEIRDVEERTREALNFWAYYMLLWGLVWTIGFLATQAAPGAIYWIWGAMIAVGMAGSAFLAIRQGSRARFAPGSRAEYIGSQLGIFYAVLYGFAALWLVVFPLSALQIGLLWITVVMFGCIISGAWLRQPLPITLGVATTALSVLGYYVAPGYFWVWSAVFAGLPLVGISIYYLRKT